LRDLAGNIGVPAYVEDVFDRLAGKPSERRLGFKKGDCACFSSWKDVQASLS